MAFVLVSCVAVPASAGENNGRRPAGRPPVVGTPCTTSVSQKEIGFLLEGASSETRLKMADPELRNQQFDDLRALFAIACQAVKEGFADEPDNAEALKFLEIAVTAGEYDGFRSKTSGATPYKWITAKRIEEFYSDRQNLSDFENFRAAAKRKSPEGKENETESRRQFAVTMIAYRESLKNTSELPADFGERTDFTIRLQQAQYLAREYQERVLTLKTKATDAEIDAYIAARPEYSTAAKRELAEKILKRARAGENFAVLARTYSEDPGSKDSGGLYKNVSVGVLQKELEEAALGLAPGGIAPRLVETAFGFHIVRLERKGETRGKDGKLKTTFDLRYILISTMVKDSDSPDAREIPVRDFVRAKLENEREKVAMDAIVKANPVTIAGEAAKGPVPGKN